MTAYDAYANQDAMGGSAGPSVKSKIVNLIGAVRTLMRSTCSFLGRCQRGEEEAFRLTPSRSRLLSSTAHRNQPRHHHLRACVGVRVARREDGGKGKSEGWGSHRNERVHLYVRPYCCSRTTSVILGCHLTSILPSLDVLERGFHASHETESSIRSLRTPCSPTP